MPDALERRHLWPGEIMAGAVVPGSSRQLPSLASEVNGPVNCEGKTSERELTGAQRRASALRLRGQGLSYREIARRLRFRGPSGAWKTVQKGLAQIVEEPARECRLLELERLDRLLEGCWPAATGEGREGLDLQAVNTVLRICERRARLLGLDAPSRFAVTQLLQSSDWARVKGAITEALADHPEAAASVADALRGIDE